MALLVIADYTKIIMTPMTGALIVVHWGNITLAEIIMTINVVRIVGIEIWMDTVENALNT